MPEAVWAARSYESARWFVVHAQPHRELTAHQHLTNQGFRSFLPLHKKTIRHARQFRSRVAPFFPRYLFVELKLGVDRWRSVTGTRGVSRMIMEGDSPKPVAPGVVEAIMAATDPSGFVTLDPTLKPGQSVRIVHGPFADLVGKLISLEDNDRVQILIDLLGAKVLATSRRQELVPA